MLGIPESSLAVSLKGDCACCEDRVLAVVFLKINESLLPVAELGAAGTCIEIYCLAGLAAVLVDDVCESESVAVSVKCEFELSVLEIEFCREYSLLRLGYCRRVDELAVSENRKTDNNDSAKDTPDEALVLIVEFF